MVVKLNMILITSPELAEFRKRLKNIESKVNCLNDPHYGDCRIADNTFSASGWPNAIHFHLQIVVSQCCCRLCSMPLGTGLRTRLSIAADLVSRVDPQAATITTKFHHVGQCRAGNDGGTARTD